MRLWEYLRLTATRCREEGDTATSLDQALDRYGTNGWELVSAVLVDGEEVFYLKREVP